MPKTYPAPIVISTIGKADLAEEIIFVSQERLLVGELIDLRPTKPADAPVYGTARIVRYVNWNDGNPDKFAALRIE